MQWRVLALYAMRRIFNQSRSRDHISSCGGMWSPMTCRESNSNAFIATWFQTLQRLPERYVWRGCCILHSSLTQTNNGCQLETRRARNENGICVTCERARMLRVGEEIRAWVLQRPRPGQPGDQELQRL